MGSLALHHRRAISAIPGANGVGALDAHQAETHQAQRQVLEALSVDDMTPVDQHQLLPWSTSFFDARAATSTSTPATEPPDLSSLELLDTSPLGSSSSSPISSPRPTSPSFALDHLSVHLPLFTSSTTTAARQDTSSAIAASRHANSNGRNAFNAPPSLSHRFSLFCTFFRSPSTSTTSLALSNFSSHLASCPNQETRPAMPSATLAAPAGAGCAPDMPDYHLAASPADETADKMSTDGKLARARSTRSADGRNRRSASPIFSLWARRHHHQQTDASNRSSTESKPNTANSTNSSVHKRATRSRSGSIQGVVPQMTREEFEALPLAIQRKYFSTLERLRFAQDSGRVDGISQHYNDISNFRRRKPRQDRSVSEHITSRGHHRSRREYGHTVPESSPSYASLPDKIKKKEFTREEQVVLARRLRASVILDAADEAICKINRRASRHLHTGNKHFDTTFPPRPASMDSHDGFRTSTDRSTGHDVPQSFFDSFRWLDEEEDLDLRLFLDDYHANLRENLPSPAKHQRPSFRRHLSISKIPFGRNSVSMSRPATKDATTPVSPAQSPPPGGAQNPLGQPRRKSRALSLITPRHVPQDSITGFDPAAAHYQDPEARLKLRVYLASPQKFDEAIEFGFPSADVLSATPLTSNDEGTHKRRPSRQKCFEDSSNMHTFFTDFDDDDENENDGGDRLSLNSPSVADPDSPKTPLGFDTKPGPRVMRPLRHAATEPADFGESSGGFMDGGYIQAPASSREMTLRMTLTRPDLRAREDEIYGWQQAQGNQPGRKSTTLAHLGGENTATYIGDGSARDNTDKMSANFEPWGPSPTEKGVMKRIWNRVRRG